MALVEELHRARIQRFRAWERKAVPDHGITMRNGWPVRPPAPVAKPEPPQPEPEPTTNPQATIIAECTALVDQVTPDIPAPEPMRRIMIDEIQCAVARYYNVRRADILSARRTANIVRPRQIAMYLCKTLTLRSLPEIGRRFFRDHTTVLHAVRKIEGLIQTDENIAREVAALTRELEGSNA